MAANKFASIVHKHTNRFTLILIYTLLEWTLIILLLLNSIFTHFTIKFAQFFNLKPPCSWCIHLTTNPHKDLCQHHSKQVSDLGFCSQHSKLADCKDLCSDCNKESKLGFDDKSLNLKCSCCGVEFKRKGFNDSGYFVINPSWEVLGFPKSVDFGGNQETEETGETEDLIQIEKEEGVKLETLTQDLEFLLDYSGNQLVPVELIEPVVDNLEDDLEVDEDQEFGEFQKAQDVSESKIETVTDELELLQENQETHSVLQDVKADESSKFIELDSMEFEETENSLVFHANSSDYSNEKPAISEPVQETEESDSDKVEAEVPIDTKDIQETEECNSENEEPEVSIGTEIPVLDTSDEIKAQDNFNLYNLSHEEEEEEEEEEEASSNSHDLDFNLEYGFQETREDEKTEDTVLIIERKDSMVEESCDGSEMDGGDPINTTEKLKSALRAERKALQALYTELEEERSASAVAASETMAMINRLHEEKAAMQMEALHYQRMMEEQSEYDQEALQLLNELMVKKEKELEVYRKKVLDYETKEKVRFLTSSAKSNTCSASCSHSEDGDGMWVDVNHELKEEGIRNGNQEITNLDSSFIDFEDERLSILEQLKVLEEKLFTLSDEEDRHFDYFNENGKHLNGNHGYDGQDGQEVNGVDTRYQDRRVIGSTGKRLLPLFDAIETETESDEGAVVSNGNGNGFHPEVENVAVTRFELQKKRIDIEEEVDQLYVRLQALEADREFLKHCIGSLKKGDKGMELLQEILQHLRDLKHVDLREKSFVDGTLV
ncbi:myosin-binding protein 3-like isoform X2 [Bidens hawaiensis]|uniref:myosin-binding protein 3-like isoform X2 n=1 Tax=Bidens hawaiensis TaxID=980011 RepID=UPI00404B87BB